MWMRARWFSVRLVRSSFMMPAAVPSPLRTNLPSALMDLKCCSQQQGQVRAQPGKSVMLFPYPSHTKWPCSAHCGKAMLLPLPPENHPHSHINHFQDAPASKTHGQRQVGEPIKLNCIIYWRDPSSILPQGVIMHLYSMLITVICNLIMTLISFKNDDNLTLLWKAPPSRHTGTPYRPWCSCRDWMGPEPDKPHLISPQQGRADSASQGRLA